MAFVIKSRPRPAPSFRPILVRLAAFVTCLVALSLVSSAPAGAAAPGSDPVGLAEQAAVGYWGNTPCQGQVTVQWQDSAPRPALPDTAVEAWVTFQTPLGMTDFAAPAATYSQCTVNVSLLSWPTYASTVEGYPQFCQMMVHEFGHFEGYADSTAYPATDVRYPLLTEANLPAVCRYDISAGTGLAATGLPPLFAPAARHAAARRRRCFEVHCASVARAPKGRLRRRR